MFKVTQEKVYVSFEDALLADVRMNGGFLAYEHHRGIEMFGNSSIHRTVPVNIKDYVAVQTDVEGLLFFVTRTEAFSFIESFNDDFEDAYATGHVFIRIDISCEGDSRIFRMKVVRKNPGEYVYYGYNDVIGDDVNVVGLYRTDEGSVGLIMRDLDRLPAFSEVPDSLYDAKSTTERTCVTALFKNGQYAKAKTFIRSNECPNLGASIRQPRGYLEQFKWETDALSLPEGYANIRVKTIFGYADLVITVDAKAKYMRMLEQCELA